MAQVRATNLITAPILIVRSTFRSSVITCARVHNEATVGALIRRRAESRSGEVAVAREHLRDLWGQQLKGQSLDGRGGPREEAAAAAARGAHARGAHARSFWRTACTRAQACAYWRHAITTVRYSYSYVKVDSTSRWTVQYLYGSCIRFDRLVKFEHVHSLRVARGGQEARVGVESQRTDAYRAAHMRAMLDLWPLECVTWD